ncbi:MAG: DUF554 domain-containing protein [Oscillospiraceae bacterium]|nr:DUF554 domain-containing protein [Oscillospiraceae bacterium]
MGWNLLPTGILTDVSSVVAGGILGCLLGSRLSERWKSLLNNMLGMAALVMGIVLILRVHTLSAAVLSMIVGALVGEALQLEQNVNRLVTKLTGKLMSGVNADETYLMQVTTVVVLFCFSGTGWYGSLYEGMTGDGSILVTKAILDGITACIFGALLGKIIPCLGVPQLCVFMLLFFVSGLVAPYITPEMIADFSAVGGIVTLTAGLRLSRIKTDIKVLNLLPSLPLAFVISALWTALVG